MDMSQWLTPFPTHAQPWCGGFGAGSTGAGAFLSCLCLTGTPPEERAALAGFVGLVGLATAGERVAFKVAIDQVSRSVCGSVRRPCVRTVPHKAPPSLSDTHPLNNNHPPPFCFK